MNLHWQKKPLSATKRKGETLSRIHGSRSISHTDTLDHALEHDGENNGLRLIRSQLVSVLEKYGVVEVGKEGEVLILIGMNSLGMQRARK